MNDDSRRPAVTGAPVKLDTGPRFWLLLSWLSLVFALSLAWPLGRLLSRSGS